MNDGRSRTEAGPLALARRLIGSGGAIVFKGSGFYKTDYRSESYKKGAEADKGSSGGSGDGGKKSEPKGKGEG